MSPVFVLAAGGTGGHLFPAEALAARLVERGAAVHLATDRRADAFAAALPGVAIARVQAGRLGGNPIDTGLGLVQMTIGFFQARRLLRRIDPEAVVGFGGYPSVPTMLAAAQLGVPTVIHEQNAVLGRANRLLARRVKRIATGFRDTSFIRDADAARVVYTGNPVRPAIRAVAGAEYHLPRNGQPLELVILGGSQGARVFSDIVPAALSALPHGLRERLRVSQQARPEDRERVAAQYLEAGITADVQSFFTDVPERLARAQLVICRSGASTVAELAAVGRPAVLVPYPHATDDHQMANARAFANSGAGWVIPQPVFSAPMLTNYLVERLADHAGLTLAAAQARRFGADDAADRLTALVLDLLRKHRRHAGGRGMRSLPESIGPIHFVGIGGIGMSGIAEVLHNLGYRVQGSDLPDSANTRRLVGLGIPVEIGHRAENLDSAEVVVISSAVKSRQSGGCRGAGAAAAGGAARRDAGRTDAAQMGRSRSPARTARPQPPR